MKLRGWLTGASLGGVLLLAALIYYGHQGRKTEDRLRVGESFLELGELERALEEVDSTLQSHPTRAAMELRRRVLGAMGNRRELEDAKSIFEEYPDSGTLTAFVQSAIRWDDEALAREALVRGKTLVEDLSDANYLALVAIVSARWGDYGAAATAFGRALELGYPENDQSQLTFGILKIQEGDLSGGLERLESIPSNSPYFAEALRSAVAVYRRSGRLDDVKRHAEAYFSMPEISISEKLATLDFVYPNASVAWTEATLDWTLQSARTGNAVADLLIWAYLDGHAPQWADETLESLPEAAFEVLPLRLVAVARARMKRMEERNREMPSVSAGLDLEVSVPPKESPYADVLQLALLEDKRMGDESVSRHVLERALDEQIEAAPEVVTGVDRFVRAFDLMTIWEPTLWRLTRDEGASAKPALGILFRLYSQERDTGDLFRVMERMVELEPNNFLALNNYVNLGLLLGRDPPRFYSLAERVGEHAGQNGRLASTYAFALVRQDRAREALEVMEALPAEARREDSVAVYYALALAAVGEREKAREVVAGMDTLSLFAEERALIDEIRLGD